MYTNHRHYILFTFALITFLVTTVGYVYLRNRVYAQAVNSVNLLKQASDLENKKQREVDVTSTYSKLTEQQKLIPTYVIGKDEEVSFVEKAEKIGDDTSTDIVISGIDRKDIVKTSRVEDNFTHVDAHIDINGTWANALRALGLVENMPYSITIKSLQISEDASKTDDTTNPKTATSTKAVDKGNRWRIGLDVSILAID